MGQLNDFITASAGGYDHNPHTGDFTGFQCVALSNAWAQFLGKPTFWGNAIDFWQQDYPTDYQKVANGTGAYPEAGDILVWGNYMGEHGHTSVFVSLDNLGFTSWDQNYPEGTDAGSRPKYCHHNFTGLLGWFHPLVESRPKAQPYQFFVAPADG